MAYLVNFTDTDTVTAASTTVQLGAHVADDLLLVFLAQDVGGTAFSTASSGWAILVQGRSGTSVRHGVAYKVATSSAETSPVFSGANDGWLATCVVVRDADPTAPFGATPTSGTDYLATAYTSSASNASGTITTAADDCLIFYSNGKDGSGGGMSVRAEGRYVRGLTQRSDIALATVFQSIGYAQQGTAGITTEFSHTLYANIATVSEGIICAVRNKSGGTRQPDIRGVIDEFRWYGTRGQTKEGATTWDALSGFAATIGGINCSAVAPTVTNNGVLASSQNASLAEASAGAGIWVGGVSTITAKDMTDTVANINFSRNAATSDSFSGTQGVIIAFGDGTNYAAYQLQTKLNGWISGTGYSRAVALGNATLYASSGTVDWANITKFAIAWHRIGSATTTVSLNIGDLILYPSPISVVGGGANRPAKFSDLVSGITGWFGVDHASRQGAAQCLFKQSVQIGDGTNKTYFDASASSLEFPLAFGTIVGSYMGLNAGEGALDLIVKAGADDTVLFSSGVAATAVKHNLTIDSASSTSATYTFAQSFVGWTPTWKTGINVSGATFSECAEIDAKGSDWTDCTIKKTTSTDAAIAFSEDGGTMTRCTIDVTGTSAAYHLELGTATTAITLTDVTFTGTPATDKVHVRATTGTVTITTSGTTSLVAGDVTSEGATVSIVAPTVERGIAFTGLQTGTSIQVFTSGTQTKLFGDNSTAGSTFSFDDATVGSITVDYTIQKAGYLPQRVTGQVLTGAVGGQLDVAVAQIVDRAYSASSGLTYGTTAVVAVGTNPTTAPGTKTFTLSTASTGQNWYSFWIEQWIDLGNATGEALANVEFPLSANGPNSFTLNDGWTFSDGATSIAYLSRDGLRYLNTSDVLQKAWAAILTAGVPSGARVRYQQVDGSGTTNAVVSSGNMDELVQIYDVGVFDYRGYLVLKVQEMGYDQAEANVVTTYGNLEDQLYVVGLAPSANGVATGDPALATAPTISQGTYTEDGKTFSVKIVDGATANTGTGIMRWLRYNFETGGSFQSEDAFNWHDLVRTNGTKFKTVNGVVYGTATTKGVLVYQNDGVTLHPDFDLFTADNGTTYSPPLSISIANANLVAGSKVLLRNDTKNTELDIASLAGVGYSFTCLIGASEVVSDGDTITIYATYASGTSYKNNYTESAVASASGITFLGVQTDWTEANALSKNGSTQTEYTADYPNIQADINSPDYTFAVGDLISWLCYIQTTDGGIRNFYGCLRSVDSGNWKIVTAVVDMYLDNVNTYTITQNDSVILMRDDNAYPQQSPTSGGGGIGMIQSGLVFVTTVTGGNVITGSAADVIAAIPSASANATAVWSKTLPL
jgi:hypothetical protein